MNWTHEDFGSVRLDAGYDGRDRTGTVRFKFISARQTDDPARSAITLTGRMNLELREPLLFVRQIEIQARQQRVNGDACASLVSAPSLHVHLHADKLDLDGLLELAPGGESAADPPDITWLNLDLSVGELHYQGVLAETVRLRLGEPVECVVVAD